MTRTGKNRNTGTVVQGQSQSPDATVLIAADGEPLIKKIKFCYCGCGGEVKNRKRQFIQGHDSKLKAIIRRVEQGEMLPPPSIADRFGRCRECKTLAYREKTVNGERTRVGQDKLLCSECREMEGE